MILVTGATGILGRVIVLQLLKKGRKVRATKRPESNLDEVKHSFRFYTDTPEEYFNTIDWVDIDFDDIDSISTALHGVEEVYHCAGKVSFNPSEKKEIYHTNISGTKNLLYACEDFQIKKFLFISSIAVLDGLNEQGYLDEESDFNPKIAHSAYAKSKHFAEMEVWRASAEGLNTIILNPGVIIGSGNWGRSSALLFKTSKYTFSGGTAFVDVRDVAQIAVQLMDENAFGERFVIVSENKSYEEVGNQIRQRLGLGKTKILSDKLLNAARFLNVFGFIFPRLKLMNKANINAVTSNINITNQKIRRRLNFDFIPVKESIDFHLENYLADQSFKTSK